MFVVVYEFDVKPGMEQDFADAWLEVTKGIYKNYGSYGSRLQRDKSGKYIGYAQWPDRETWSRDWPAEEFLAEPRQRMRSCLVSSSTVYEAEVVADYLQQQPNRKKS